MIINILLNIATTLIGFLGRIISLASMPQEIKDNIIATINLLFDNLGMINIICHLSYLKIVMGLLVSIVAFRISWNTINFIVVHRAN